MSSKEESMPTAFFYGYVILAFSFSNMVFVRGVAGSFSLFYVALLEEFQWSHGIGASIVSLNSLIYALTSPLIGWLFDRLGPRILMRGLEATFMTLQNHTVWPSLRC